MKTNIRLAGGTLKNPGKLIWKGELPHFGENGLVLTDETNPEAIATYYVSQVMFHFNSDDQWQTLFVVPYIPKKTEK